MSGIMGSEEFKRLLEVKGLADDKTLSIVEEIVESTERTGSVKASIIQVYAEHIEEVRDKRNLYEAIALLFERFSPRIGVENVYSLVKNLIKD